MATRPTPIQLDFSTAYPEVLLLVGTQTGNAARVADDVAARLEAYGFDVDLRPMEEAEPALLGEASQLIVCTSTHGDGELPDAAQPLYEALAALQPDLEHLAYGVIALGDRTYGEHFAAAGRRWRGLLDACGALEVIEPHIIDRGPRRAQIDEAGRWSLFCAAAFAEAFAYTDDDGDAVLDAAR